ncbi:MmcQ/YjbR family DNA-binding protein [Ornithinimicrobium panacihumi]|uniref:MmcQ/YjbR family DNA-binding protein n=1 Tax=Ornithinimicrobium panacihumi TaxID=2008449 RepID=UPI003F88D41C
MPKRPEVPESMIDRLVAVAAELPQAYAERAWVGTRWRVGKATFAHVFGGEDGLFRITLRGDPEEVAAFEHLGMPYFRAGWGGNVIGLVLDDRTDWDEVVELFTISYCIQAPAKLAREVEERLGSGD